MSWSRDLSPIEVAVQQSPPLLLHCSLPRGRPRPMCSIRPQFPGLSSTRRYMLSLPRSTFWIEICSPLRECCYMTPAACCSESDSDLSVAEDMILRTWQVDVSSQQAYLLTVFGLIPLDCHGTLSRGALHCKRLGCARSRANRGRCRSHKRMASLCSLI